MSEKILFILFFICGMLLGNFIFYFLIEKRMGEPIATPIIKTIISGTLFAIGFLILT